MKEYFFVMDHVFLIYRKPHDLLDTFTIQLQNLAYTEKSKKSFLLFFNPYIEKDHKL